MGWNLNIVSLLVPLLFLLIGLTITVVVDPYISRKHRLVMLIIIVLSVSLIVQNIWVISRRTIPAGSSSG